jgi:hypothetical protein
MALHQIVFGHTATGSGQTYSLGEEYPLTRGGLTFGFDADLTANDRDRNSAFPPELRGCVFAVNASGLRYFRFDLPEGSGEYDIRLALGDAGSEQEIRARVLNGVGGTELEAISGTSSASGDTGGFSWFDATGVKRQGVPEVGQTGYATSWPFTNEALRANLTGPLVIEMATASTSLSTALAFVSLEFISGGGGSIAPILNNYRRRRA